MVKQELQPGDTEPMAVIARGWAYARNSGDEATARGLFDLAVETWPASEVAWLNRGLYLHDWLKDYPGAVASYIKVLEISASAPADLEARLADARAGRPFART